MIRADRRAVRIAAGIAGALAAWAGGVTAAQAQEKFKPEKLKPYLSQPIFVTPRDKTAVVIPPLPEPDKTDYGEVCAAFGSEIALGTYDVLGFRERGIDSGFRSAVQNSKDPQAILAEVFNVTPPTAGRVRAGSIAWMMLNSPNPAARKAAYLLQVQSAVELLAEREGIALSPTKRSYRPSQSALLAKAKELLTKRLAAKAWTKRPPLPQAKLFNVAPAYDYAGELALAELAAPIACASVFPTYVASCLDGLPKLLKRAAPKVYRGEYGQFSTVMDPLLASVLTDPKYEGALLRTALTMLGHYESGEKGAKITTDVFMDLLRSFMKEGFATNQSLGLAWNVLGAYGTQGAAIAVLEPFVHPATQYALAALEIISAGMGALDLFTDPESRRFYSLPTAVRGACRFAKPYHFWLSAFTAYRLHRNLGTEAQPVVLTHLLGYLYEAGSRTNGREILAKAFTREGLLSPHNDSIRAAIVAKDLGAVFGAGFARYLNKTGALDFDQKLGSMRRAAKPAACTEKDLAGVNSSGGVLSSIHLILKNAKLMSCFDDVIVPHAIKSWSEIEF